MTLYIKNPNNSKYKSKIKKVCQPISENNNLMQHIITKNDNNKSTNNIIRKW